MSYRVVVTERAEKQLRRLDRAARDRCVAAIRKLGDDPRPAGARKLVNRPGFRIRVGDYRVIYTVIDTEVTVTVIEVGHRGDVYR